MSLLHHKCFQKAAAARLVHPEAVRASNEFKATLVDDMRDNPEAWNEGYDKLPTFFDHYIDKGSRMTAGPSVLNPLTGQYLQGSDLMHKIRAGTNKLVPTSMIQSKATRQHYDSFAKGPIEAYTQLLNEGVHNFDPKKTIRHQRGMRATIDADLRSAGLIGDGALDHDGQMKALRSFMQQKDRPNNGIDYTDAERKAFDILVKKRRSPLLYNAMVLSPLRAVDTVTAPVTDRL